MAVWLKYLSEPQLDSTPDGFSSRSLGFSFVFFLARSRMPVRDWVGSGAAELVRKRKHSLGAKAIILDVSHNKTSKSRQTLRSDGELPARGRGLLADCPEGRLQCFGIERLSAVF